MKPASGSMSPASIRIVVVLPAPLGPRKPYTTPVGTERIQAIDRRASAVALAEPSRHEGYPT